MSAEPVARLLAALDGVKPLGAGWTARCPAHDDRHNSLKIDVGRDGQALIHCHAGCEFSGVLDLLGMAPADLFPPRDETVSQNGHGSRIVDTYDYRDENGTLLCQAVRYEPKEFRQRRPDGAGGWAWNLQDTRRVLYRLPELLAADPAAWVLVCEGEKDVDRLRGLGFIATTNAMGAGKWRSEYAEALRGRRVCILPDHDEAGEKHAAEVAKSLYGVATEVCILRLPDLPPKGDVSDWLDAGGTADELDRLIEAAPAWEPATRANATGAASARGESGNVILNDLEAFLRRYIAYPSDHTRVAHTLWIVHTYLMEVWDSTPRLAFLSPEPASGKTRGLEVSELLVPRPIEAVNVSAAYLFRKVDDADGAPTILFDEVDTVFGPKAREHEDVRGLLNAGHRKGAVAGRCVVRGKAVETVEYPAYCAVALAGLGDLPDTILTRAVVIRMRRRARSERVEPFRRRLAIQQGHPLRDRIAAWAKGVSSALEDVWPEMPAGVEDRDADVWEALLAVADAAGGEWPKRARVAAVALVAQSKESTPSLGIRLLDDLRTVFNGRDAMTTDAILTALQDLPEAPWAEIVAGKPLNARGLAKRLGGYGVKSKQIRVGEQNLRGYAREDLDDAWERYLVPDGVADDAQAVAEADGGLSSSPRESATSATSATTDVHTSPPCGGNPHNDATFWPNGVARSDRVESPTAPPLSATPVTAQGFGRPDVADVADFQGDRDKNTDSWFDVADDGHEGIIEAEWEELTV